MDIQTIIHTHKEKIFKTCLGYTGTVEEAKDLVQEVCINLWKGLESFRKEAQISTWIYRVTVNTCLMYKRKNQPKILGIATLSSQPITEKETTSNEEDLLLLRRFIAELPEKERIIMILYLENLSYEEIAEVTGITTNYIGVKINRIKKSLSKKFTQHGRITNNLE